MQDLVSPSIWRGRAASRPRLAAAALAALATLAVATAGPAGAGQFNPESAAPGPSPTAAAPAALAGADGEYTAIAPVRFLDTREGLGTTKFPFVPEHERSVNVLAAPGMPSANVSAVVVNITADNPTDSTYITAWPTGTAKPGVSNLNVAFGKTVSNLATVRVGSGGQINLYNHGGWVQVIGDIVGYYSTAAGNAGSRFVPSSPQRILDTRSGFGWPAGKLGLYGELTLDVKGRGDVPENATAVVLNLTATDAEANGYLRATGDGLADSRTSSLNYEARRTRANLAIVKLPASGNIGIYSLVPSNVIADVMGWYTEERVGDRGRYKPADMPERLFDLRDYAFQLPPDLAIGGTTADSYAVVLNLTSVDAIGPGFLSVAPADVPAPASSNLNYNGQDIVPNHVYSGTSVNPTVIDGESVPVGSWAVRAGINDTFVVADFFGAFLK